MSRVPADPSPGARSRARAAEPSTPTDAPADILDHPDAWEEEIARRMEEVRTGKVKTIPLDQAMAEIRAELDRRR